MEAMPVGELESVGAKMPMLGTMYYNGQGVPQDYAEAVK
jgi:TPR repeat protein